MSKIKSTLAATFLTLVLTAPVMAGNIGTPGCPSPALPPPICEIESPCAPDLGDTGSTDQTTSALLNLLLAVLGVI